MSKAKKPGTDLAALKARLAKKTKGDVPDVPPPGHVAMPAAAVPPPGEPAPAFAPQAPPIQHVPPPGEAYVPAAASPYEAYDVPPPGQVYQPPAEQPHMRAAAAATRAHNDDDPFGGAVITGFDPNAGVIDGGDVAPRGNKGLAVFAGLFAAALGAVVGYMGNNIVTKRGQVASGKEKGEKMVAEVQKVSELRKTISLELDGIKKQIAENPAAAGEALTNLLVAQFNEQPKIDELFGWQLASVHKVGVKQTFTLYAEANRLQLELGILAGFLIKFADQLKAAGGPALFGVMGKSDGVKMVTIVQPMCGEVPKDAPAAPPAEGAAAAEPAKQAPVSLDALKPCENAENAVGFKVMEGLSGEPVVRLKGSGKDQVQIIVPDQDVYLYAVGMEPAKNALGQLDFQLTRISERLEAMNKAEKIALKALSNYADSPDVDGSVEQPDPGEGE